MTTMTLAGLLLSVAPLAHAQQPKGGANPTAYVRKHVGRWLREGAPWGKARPLPRSISAAALRRFGHWAIHTSKDKTRARVYSFNPNTHAKDFDGSFYMAVRLLKSTGSEPGRYKRAAFRIKGGGYQGVMRYDESRDGITYMRMSRRIRIAGTRTSYEREVGEIKYNARTGETWLRDKGWDKIERDKGHNEIGWFKGPTVHTGLAGAKKLTVLNWVLGAKKPPETASTYLRNLTLLF